MQKHSFSDISLSACNHCGTRANMLNWDTTFGSPLLGRSCTAESLNGYRYSFNGKEKDYEINGNSIDFGERIHDSRTGKWFSTDPLQAKYPDLSPYCFGGNNPIFYIDIDGRIIEVPDKNDRVKVLEYFKNVGLEGAYKINKHGIAVVNKKWVKKNAERLNNDPALKDIYDKTTELVNTSQETIIFKTVKDNYSINEDFEQYSKEIKYEDEFEEQVTPGGETVKVKTGNKIAVEYEKYIGRKHASSNNNTASRTLTAENSKKTVIFLNVDDKKELNGDNGKVAPANETASFFHELLDHGYDLYKNNGTDPDTNAHSDKNDVEMENKVREKMNVEQRSGTEHEN